MPRVFLTNRRPENWYPLVMRKILLQECPCQNPYCRDGADVMLGQIFHGHVSVLSLCWLCAGVVARVYQDEMPVSIRVGQIWRTRQYKMESVVRSLDHDNRCAEMQHLLPPHKTFVAKYDNLRNDTMYQLIAEPIPLPPVAKHVALGDQRPAHHDSLRLRTSNT